MDEIATVTLFVEGSEPQGRNESFWREKKYVSQRKMSILSAQRYRLISYMNLLEISEEANM